MNVLARPLHNVQSATPTSAAVMPQDKKSPRVLQDAQAISADVIQIRSGVLPSLKGAGAGLLAGGVMAAGSSAVVISLFNHFSDYTDELGELGVFMGGGLGAMAGAVTGAIVANQTDDKQKAAFYGAAVGGGIGLAMGALGGDLRSALTWAAIGAGSGVGGAYAGAAVAQRK